MGGSSYIASAEFADVTDTEGIEDGWIWPVSSRVHAEHRGSVIQKECGPVRTAVLGGVVIAKVWVIFIYAPKFATSSFIFFASPNTHIPTLAAFFGQRFYFKQSVANSAPKFGADADASFVEMLASAIPGMAMTPNARAAINNPSNLTLF